MVKIYHLLPFGVPGGYFVHHLSPSNHRENPVIGRKKTRCFTHILPVMTLLRYPDPQTKSMFYIVFAIFCIGAALLQSAYLRAPKGVVATRRRVIYALMAALATAVEVLVGAMKIEPAYIGAMLGIPIFYVINKGTRSMSLRLRYTYRIGLFFVLLTIVPLVRMMLPMLPSFDQ
ncbi:MAG TPA: hypothetical protein VGB94_11510 [Acidobacteriaceae bacterium]